MKTTILTIALALATMPLTFAAKQTPTTAPADSKTAATTPAKRVKKHHKKTVKTVKTNAKAAAATTAPAPVKQ